MTHSIALHASHDIMVDIDREHEIWFRGHYPNLYNPTGSIFLEIPVNSHTISWIKRWHKNQEERKQLNGERLLMLEEHLKLMSVR